MLATYAHVFDETPDDHLPAEEQIRLAREQQAASSDPDGEHGPGLYPRDDAAESAPLETPAND